jgi:hypothetical protein
MLIFASCKNTKTKKHSEAVSNLEMTDTMQNTDDCLDSDLYKCICSYINTSGVFFMDDFPNYINLYFFSKDTIDYFTIWRDFSVPNYFVFDKTFDFFHLKIDLINCSSCLKNIDNCDLFFIHSTEYDTDLYIPCFDISDKCIIQDTIVVHNDGRLFIQTYKYNKFGDKFNIEKLEKPIVDFLGNPPERFW